MIERAPLLTRTEHHAVQRLIARILTAADPPLLRAILFGSKARGDFDTDSDIDLLLIVDLPPDERELASQILSRDARIIGHEFGIELESWAVPAGDLEEGRRTPMLVDALEDGLTLWPLAADPLALPFTPADAVFCADRLLEWVDEGGHVIEEALESGRRELAAKRARDDITRLASAALLLIGETRHRRVSTIRLFIERFIEEGLFTTEILPALEWAIAAYPVGNLRGTGRPPPSFGAVASAERGYELARLMASRTIPFISHLVRLGSSEVSDSVDGGPPVSILKSPILWAMKR